MEQLNSNDIEPRETTQTGMGMARYHKPVVWMILTILLIAVCAGLAYLWYTTQRTLNDKDARVNSLSSELSSAKDAVARLKAEAVSSAPAVAKADDQMIKEVVTADTHAMVNYENTTPTISVKKLQLPFAGVDVTHGQTGTYCVLKKADGMWLKLFCAQGQTSYADSMMQMYGVPRSIIAS